MLRDYGLISLLIYDLEEPLLLKFFDLLEVWEKLLVVEQFVTMYLNMLVKIDTGSLSRFSK